MERQQSSQLIIFPDPRVRGWEMEATMGKKLKIVSIIYYHQVKGGKNVYLEIYVHLHFYQKPPWAYQPAKKKK